MIGADKRKAVFLLDQEGMSRREISRRMNIDRKTVDTIINQNGVMPNSIREDKIKIDTGLLRQLYNECKGYVQRVHEKLVEERGIKIGYSTLARMICSLQD